MMPGLTKSRWNGPPIELLFIDDPNYYYNLMRGHRCSHSRKQLFNYYHWTQAEEPDEEGWSVSVCLCTYLRLPPDTGWSINKRKLAYSVTAIILA